MYTPYEIIVKSVLPAVRSILVKELSSRYGYKQTEIAEALYITQASVSYYMSRARGKYIEEIYKHKDVVDMIERLADKIHRERPSKEELMKELNDIIIYILVKEYICDMHKIIEPDFDIEECKVCEAIIQSRFG